MALIVAGEPQEAPVGLRVYAGYPVDALFRLVEDGGGVDLTDSTGAVQVRRSPGNALLLELDFEPVLPQTGDDKGRFRVACDADATSSLYAVVAVWDVRRVDGDDVPHRHLGGPAFIEQPVSVESGS